MQVTFAIRSQWLFELVGNFKFSVVWYAIGYQPIYTMNEHFYEILLLDIENFEGYFNRIYQSYLTAVTFMDCKYNLVSTSLVYANVVIFICLFSDFYNKAYHKSDKKDTQNN